MVLWLVTAAWGAPCSTPVTQAQIGERADAMLAAFSSFDEMAFGSARDQLFLDIGCVSEPLQTGVAARVHLAAGVGHFTAGETELARAGLDAAHQLDASVWIADMVPEAHPLDVMWTEAETLAYLTEPVPVPVSGVLLWDGRKGRERPSSRATLAQHVVDNEVQFTAWVAPGQPLPRYEAKTERDPKIANRVAFGGAGIALAGGVLYGAALASRAKFNTYDPTIDFDSREQWANEQQRRTNLLTGASGVLGVAGLTTIAVSRTF